MALTPEDSKAVSKAIQDAMAAAVKSFGGRGAIGGGKTDRNDVAEQRANKNPTKKDLRPILATAQSLEKLTGAANNSANALSGLTKQSNLAKKGFIGFTGSMGATTKSITESRNKIKAIDFSKVADDVSKAISDSIASGKIETKQPTAGPIVAKFGSLVKNGVNPRLESLTASLGRFNNVVRGGIGVMSGVIKELREIGVLKSKKRSGPGPAVEHSVHVRPTVVRPERDLESHNRSQEQQLADKALEEQNRKLEKEKERREALNEKPTGLGDAFEKSFKTKLESLGHSASSVDHTFSKLSIVGGALHKALNAIVSNGIEVLDDMFHKLAGRGYGTSDSLVTLYKGAIDAGMTLRDYAQFMDDNMIAVSRASSFTAFQANLKTSTDTLAKFGVFGEDATKLAGTMMSASTALGVPQEQMGEAMSRQLGVFEKLRKTTNITANEFEAMTKQLGEDAQIRTELSALDPKEAAMRQAAILDQMSYARSLNLSTSEVQKYTQAILEQRKSTVKQRFQQSNLLTQTAGLLGMGGQAAEELRTLSMNKYKTDDQQQRYMELLGQVNTGLETMQQQGGPGSQYQSDTMRERLDQSGLAQQLEAASAVKAGKQSGDVKNKDIGKQLGDVAQGLGKLSIQLDGWMKNPVGQFIVTGVGALGSIAAALLTFNTFADRFGIMAGTTIAKILGKGGLGGAATTDLPPGSEGPTSGKGKWAGRAATGLKIAGGLAVAGIGAAQTYGAYQDYQTAAKAQDDGTEDPVEARKKKIQAGTAGVFSGISTIGGIAMMLSPFLGPAAPVALAVGGIASAIGAFGGMFSDGIGGLISKIGESKAVEEKNTKAILKSNKLAEDQLRSKMPSSQIADTNLGQFGSEGVRAGQASRTNTRGERDRAYDDQLSPEDLKKKYDKETNAELAKATEAQKAQAKIQAANDVKSSMPEGQTPDQTKVDARSTEILRQQALDRVMTQVRKDQAADTSYVPTAPSILASSIQGPQTTNPATPAQNQPSVNGVQGTNQNTNPLTNFSGLPYNPYAQNKPKGSIFGQPDPRTQTAITAAAATAAATIAPPVPPAPTPVPTIATPVSPTPTTVNPGTVNTGEKDAKADADRKAAATQAATALAPPSVQDPADVLKQILDILKQSLLAENQQVDLTGQILRSQALMPTLPDKAAMYQQSARQ